MGESGGRKDKLEKKFAKSILRGNVGRPFGYEEQDAYFQEHFEEPSVCGYLRHPRINRRKTRVFGLCQHSPEGRIKITTTSDVPKNPLIGYQMGLCRRSIAIDSSFVCPYEIEALAEIKLKGIKGIAGVEFREMVGKHGVDAYANWGGNHIKLRAHIGSFQEIRTIHNIYVLGKFEGILPTGRDLTEKITPIQRRKKSNITSFLSGMEGQFLEEMLAWFIANEYQDRAFHDRKEFRKSVRIASD